MVVDPPDMDRSAVKVIIEGYLDHLSQDGHHPLAPGGPMVQADDSRLIVAVKNDPFAFEGGAEYRQQ